MKIKRLFLIVVMAALALSACGNASATPPSAEEILSSVNIAVVLTSMSQPKIAESDVIAPTATPAPISALTTFATATLIKPISTATFSSYAASASACDSSVYVSDVTISDGTVIAPGETFTKTWKLENTGTCTWNSNYTIMFSSGDNMSGETTTIEQSVSPNETADISVELTAPEEEGTYTGYWILTNKNGTAFGNFIYVQIIVSEDAATSTPTATTEATATETSVSTSTPIPTDMPTPVPTDTPTSTPTDTPIPVDTFTITPEP